MPTVFVAGLLAGSAAMLVFGPRADKGDRPRASQHRSADGYDLGDWSGQFVARQAGSPDDLPPAPLGWY
jgi:hypothetical protein